MRRGDYLDPAIVLERRQEASCAGCAYLERDLTPGFRKFTCSEGVQKASQDVLEMPKCRKFTEGRSAVGVKEKIVGAVQSKDLAWHAEFERAIDRLTAFGMSDPLGCALWRFKYLNDAAAYKRALYLLVKKSSARVSNVTTEYLIKIATGVMCEWALDACDACHGVGKITERNGMVTNCTKCEGSGIKKYSDWERERNCNLASGTWNRGHEKKFNEVMTALVGATAATGGRVKELLKDTFEDFLTK